VDYEVPPLARVESPLMRVEVTQMLLGLARACAETGLALDEARVAERRADAEIFAAERGGGTPAVVEAARRRYEITATASDELELFLADLVARFAVAATGTVTALLDGQQPSRLGAASDGVDFATVYSCPGMVPLVQVGAEDDHDPHLREAHAAFLRDLEAAHSHTGPRMQPKFDDGCGGFRRQLVEHLHEYAHSCCYALAGRLRRDAQAVPQSPPSMSEVTDA
jgi:hypothetical protein